MTQAEVKWVAPEFDYREKSASWYWQTIVVAVLILGFAVWERNFLFMIFVIVAEILVLVWGDRKPEHVEFILTPKGLTIGGEKFYPLHDIDHVSFDDREEGEWPDIVIRFKAKFRTLLRINVPRAQLEEVRNAFRESVPEAEREESLADVLERFLRF